MKSNAATENGYGSIHTAYAEEKGATEAFLPLHHHHRHHRASLTDSAESLSSDAFPRFLARGISGQWDDYVSAVERRPLLTKSLTAVIIFSVADASAQGLEHARGVATPDAFDWLRCARFAAFGLFGAPWSHFYFMWLDKCLPPSENPWSITTLQKVFIDQFVQAPILLAIMICALSLMKGEGFIGMKQDMSGSFLAALIANCKSSVVCVGCEALAEADSDNNWF